MRRVLAIGLCAILLAGCVTESNHPKPVTNFKAAARDNVTMGMIYLQRHERTLALHSFGRALKLNPDSVKAHNAMALLDVELGELARARKYYRASLNLRPNDPETLNAYGVLLCRTGQVHRAIHALVKAAKTASYITPEVAYTNAGVCALRLRDQSTAIRYFSRAIALNDNYAPALWQLANLDMRNHAFHRARSLLTRLADLPPKPAASVLWLLIRSEWAVKDSVAAERYGAILLEDYPGSPEALAFLHHHPSP
ncbi:MAG: type IV pilus biogenesis/stability protein PilW [Gammaproteobacteria bacterium]